VTREATLHNLRCPSCGLNAQASPDYEAAVDCPRCLALQQRVKLEPLEQPRYVEASFEEHPEPV
jgi:phage FluMu protein Com